MSKLSQSFNITGVANDTAYDATGLKSTEAEPKFVKRVLIFVTGYAANKIQLWLEREKLREEYDYHFITDASSGSTNVQYTTQRMLAIELERQIPIGKTLKAAIQCGATNKNVFGSYEYEITS